MVSSYVIERPTKATTLWHAVWGSDGMEALRLVRVAYWQWAELMRQWLEHPGASLARLKEPPGPALTPKIQTWAASTAIAALFTQVIGPRLWVECAAALGEQAAHNATAAW